ncbi:MAG: lysophospholipid acyltransferase family protein [Gemmatimonadota bacterium]
MAKRYVAEHRGKLFNLLWPLTRYLITNLSVAVAFVLFFLFNRTTVLRRRNVPRRRNTLLLSNHQSMIDSFLVGMCAYYPWSWLKPSLIPWNPAAQENFYGQPLLAWFSDQWKCIPVREGRRDLRALYRMMTALRGGTMTLFPEGTRSRDGSVGPGRPGAGLLVLGNHPTVIPVAIDGMGDLLPVGSRWPRLGKRVYVYFGRPFDTSEFLTRPRSKETAQELVDRVLVTIRRQQRAVRRLRRFRARYGRAASTPRRS